MRKINVETINGVQQEIVYNADDMPVIEELFNCKDSKKRNVNYMDIPCAFDIETTNIYKLKDNGDIDPILKPFAFMYHWQFCLNEKVIFGRTWNSFIEWLKILERKLNLSLNNRLVVYVHNLSFEWQFMHQFIEFDSGFFTEERNPLKIVTTSGIEFRCSSTLSNMSLAKFCENEEGVIHYKLVDTFDYSKIRTPATPLTEEEEAYCYNDVRGLAECIRSRLKYDTMAGMPMTSTGYVRRDLRHSVQGDKKYRQRFVDTQLDVHLYGLNREGFRGGDCHGNLHYIRQILDGNGDGLGYDDMVSSYPTRMMLDLFPGGKFFKMSPKTFYNRDNSDMAMLIQVAFKNIRYTGVHGMPYIPIAKCIKKSAKRVVDNGRILYADFLVMTITDIDLKIILDCYDMDDYYVNEVWASEYQPLDPKIKNVVMDYFRKKTALKGIESKQYEYNKSKNNLNSTYGCMVMRIDHQLIEYDPTDYSYHAGDKTLEELLGKFYKSRNNFLSYQHGVWITAHARKALREGMKITGDKTVYCDTDSLVYLGDHSKEFEALNNSIIERCKKAGAYAEDAEGKIRYMGVWEHEHLERFKTLGAKKYVYEKYKTDKKTGEKKLETVSTIAGVKKSVGSKYFAEHGLEAFEYGVKISNSGHLTAFYNDDPIHEIVIDNCRIITGANVALVDNSYTFKRDEDYINLIDQNNGKVGYIYI